MHPGTWHRTCDGGDLSTVMLLVCEGQGWLQIPVVLEAAVAMTMMMMMKTRVLIPGLHRY
jgi:hypothetical protein